MRQIAPMPFSSSETLPLQPASLDTWRDKYQLRTQDGEIIDKTVNDTFYRVATNLAQYERYPEEWRDKFYWALCNGAIPAGRVLSNAGAQEHKPNTSTINCTVSGTIEDSMHGILRMAYESGITLSAGCGIGYEFSTLRPRGAFVAGVGAKTSGVMSFMNIYDSICFTVASAGGRRGAQMGTMAVTHPDIRDFIRAKRENGRLRQFNLSVLITDEFMKAVDEDKEYWLWFPHNKKEKQEPEGRYFYQKWPYVDSSMIEHTKAPGHVLCKGYEKVRAREIWNLIMRSNFDFAEPGFILIDKVNSENNLHFCENIRATNPCGEQPLPPYGSCLLGSVNLTMFVENPFTPHAMFNMAKFAYVVAIFTRMLDNVVEINGLPLPQQREEIMRKRRHGMGFLGLGSMLTMMRIKYGSDAAVQLTAEISETLAVAGWQEGIKLAQEKGCAPVLKEFFDGKTGAHLMLQSEYMNRLTKKHPELAAIETHGCRFTHHTSIAPTGTISLSLANNASNGIEPTFGHRYTRNKIKEGRSTKEAVQVYSYEYLLYCKMHDLDPDSDETLKGLPDYFVSADDLTPAEHVRMQAAAQPWIDSAISKTVNVPADITFDNFKEVYMMAWRSGLKGCSTFRFNPAAFSGVLVKESDLENTSYVFQTENGDEVTLKGNEEVEYEGEIHRASNLFDAIKEGYFGRLA